jgi:hypothetical protein
LGSAVLKVPVDNDAPNNKGAFADAPNTHPPTLILGRSRTNMKGNAGQNSGLPQQ